MLRYAGLLNEAAERCDAAFVLDRKMQTSGLRTCAMVFVLRGDYPRAMNYLQLDQGSDFAKALTIDMLARQGRTQEALQVGAPNIPGWKSYDVLRACLAGQAVLRDRHVDGIGPRIRGSRVELLRRGTPRLLRPDGRGGRFPEAGHQRKLLLVSVDGARSAARSMRRRPNIVRSRPPAAHARRDSSAPGAGDGRRSVRAPLYFLMASALLDDYLERVGLTSARSPDLATLRRLHEAHVAAIPFENLDILLGHDIHLELDRLRDKLIARRRGGYCFEQNALFAAILQESGYTVMSMEARVRAGSTALRPRTHMVLAVQLEGLPWLADVGFGGEGLLEPVPMSGEASMPASGLVHRVVEEGDLRVLQMRRASDWEDQYAFAMQPVHPVDFEMANWFTSTHPQSPFVRTLTVQRTTRAVRYVLRYPAYTEIRDSGSLTREIARNELLPLLRDVFLIELPEDTVFSAIDSRS